MATHSSILTWEISWTEEPDRLQSMGSQQRQEKFSFQFHSVKFETLPFISTFKKPYPFFNSNPTSLFSRTLNRNIYSSYFFLVSLKSLIGCLQVILKPFCITVINYSSLPNRLLTRQQGPCVKRQLTVSLLINGFRNISFFVPSTKALKIISSQTVCLH